MVIDLGGNLFTGVAYTKSVHDQTFASAWLVLILLVSTHILLTCTIFVVNSHISNTKHKNLHVNFLKTMIQILKIVCLCETLLR